METLKYLAILFASLALFCLGLVWLFYTPRKR